MYNNHSIVEIPNPMLQSLLGNNYPPKPTTKFARHRIRYTVPCETSRRKTVSKTKLWWRMQYSIKPIG